MVLSFILLTKAILKVRILSSVVIISILQSGLPTVAQPGASSILKSMIEHADSTHTPIILFEGIILHNDLFISFYRPNHYAIAWQKQKNIEDLINAIRGASSEGLTPSDYHLKALIKYHLKQKTEHEIMVFDLLLTDAFLSYSSHLLLGKLDPEILYPNKWDVERADVDLVLLLQNALIEQTVARTLEDLQPQRSDYKKLKASLEYFKEIKAKRGWPRIPEGPSVAVGMIDGRIPLIRKRLSITGQLPVIDQSLDTKYDSALFAAVREFQQQHGLGNDGLIGKTTFEYLNYSVDDYIDKIRINLERHRWLPRKFGSQFIRVNIPAFMAEIFEADSMVLSMRAILGRPDRITPVLSSNMRYLVYNPTWTVPPTILEEDALPAIKKNIKYLETHHIRVIDYGGAEIAPENLPWSSYSVYNFPYILRQDPGLFNSLGLIKFEFPNEHRVFLHDTNNRSLFDQSYRALSSGCIRIEKPFELAAYLLKGTSWTREKLHEAVSSGETGTILFQKYEPIHIVYFTAFIDGEDNFQMRNDIYGWDQPILEAL